MTASVSGPWNPTIITAPISSSSVSPPGPSCSVGEADGLGMAEGLGRGRAAVEPEHEMLNATTARASAMRRKTRLLTPTAGDTIRVAWTSMRLAVVSDIHGNLPALEAVLADLEEVRPDAVVLGGDLALGGPHPVEVVDRLRQLRWPSVLGNGCRRSCARHSSAWRRRARARCSVRREWGG